MDIKPTLPFLETMVTQACNLSCRGCTNYSDLPFKGMVKWSTAQYWIKSWLTRINIQDFGIIGGEPLLNRDIESWLYGCRQLLPNAQIRFTTNGLLMDSPDHLLKILDEIGNVVFKITVHVNDNRLEEVIKKVFALRDWVSVTEHGIDRWKTKNNVRFQINRPTKFIMTYSGSYSNMMPYYSDPEKAFDLCVQKTCPLLFDGKIYKCSTAGLLQTVMKKVKPVTEKFWEEFIDPGISVESTDEDINRFIANFGKPNKICSQCPQDRRFLIDHRATVLTQKTPITN
jgi:organic radical activating enzyme